MRRAERMPPSEEASTCNDAQAPATAVAVANGESKQSWATERARSQAARLRSAKAGWSFRTGDSMRKRLVGRVGRCKLQKRRRARWGCGLHPGRIRLVRGRRPCVYAAWATQFERGCVGGLVLGVVIGGVSVLFVLFHKIRRRSGKQHFGEREDTNIHSNSGGTSVAIARAGSDRYNFKRTLPPLSPSQTAKAYPSSSSEDSPSSHSDGVNNVTSTNQKNASTHQRLQRRLCSQHPTAVSETPGRASTKLRVHADRG
jgi:hypothetical protein